MSQARITFAVLLVALVVTPLLTVTGCGPKKGVGDDSGPKRVVGGDKGFRIQGQVFIVTRGRENVRLGLVTVYLLPADSVIDHLSRVQASARAESLRLEAELAQAASVLDISLRRLKSTPLESYMPPGAVELRDAHEAAVAKGTDDAGDLLLSLDKCYGGQHWGDLLSEGPRVMMERLAREQQVNAMNAATDRSRQQTQPVKRSLEELHSPSLYMANLPKAVATAQTDADGEFALAVPGQGQYVLAAHTTRELFGGTESYTWLIRLPEDARQGAKVLLSNETLTSSNSTLSLLHTEK